MELRIAIFIVFLGFFACQSANNNDTSKISQLKKILNEDKSKANRDALITAYQEEIKTDSNNTNRNAAYFKEIASLHVMNKDFVKGLQTLMTGIQNYPKSNSTGDNVWMIGDIYAQNIQRPNVAIIIKKLYAKQFPSERFGTVAKKLVTENNADVSEDIIALGSSMYDEQTHKVNFQAANDYIRICELFALIDPQNEQSPDYLHKAGETARAIRAFPKAVEIYDRIYSNYPKYEKAAQALFLRAFTYDNDLGDKATAKVLYEEFLQKYPNDDFADDTQFLLENLGKDDEEIIKGFSKKG